METKSHEIEVEHKDSGAEMVVSIPYYEQNSGKLKPSSMTADEAKKHCAAYHKSIKDQKAKAEKMGKEEIKNKSA